MNVVQLQCGSCPSASEPEAARLTALHHHVQELVDSAGREPARPPGSRMSQECQDAECVCLPARSASGSWPVTLYSVARTFMQTSYATAPMGYCADDRGRHRVARVPVPLAWNSARRGRRGSPRRLMGAVYQERGHLDDGNVAKLNKTTQLNAAVVGVEKHCRAAEAHRAQALPAHGRDRSGGPPTSSTPVRGASGSDAHEPGTPSPPARRDVQDKHVLDDGTTEWRHGQRCWASLCIQDCQAFVIQRAKGGST